MKTDSGSDNLMEQKAFHKGGRSTKYNSQKVGGHDQVENKSVTYSMCEWKLSWRITKQSHIQ